MLKKIMISILAISLSYLQSIEIDHSRAITVVSEYQYSEEFGSIALLSEKYGRFDLVETQIKDASEGAGMTKIFAVDTAADEVCGYIEFEEERDGAGYIETVMIEEDYRRKGVASCLLQLVLNRYYQKFPSVRMYVTPLEGHDTPLHELIEFYQKNGGHIISRDSQGADVEFRSSKREADSDQASSAHTTKKSRN